jgi:hypothetical protein
MSGFDHRFRRLCWLGLAVFGVSCFEHPPFSDGIIAGHVIVSAPVEGAQVSVWQLTPAGEKFELLAEDVTDELGWFSVHVGQAAGGILIEAKGGLTAEPWAPGEGIGLEQGLRAVLMDYLPGPLGTVRTVTVSPLTTIATALAESRLAHPDREDDYKKAIRRAYALLGEHFGGINLIETPVASTSIEADPNELSDDVRHALILAGLSGLAQWIAEESRVSALAFNTVKLTAKLVEDTSDERALFDGKGPGGPLRAGFCPVPAACDTDPSACATVCDLDANTLRADLATGLAFYFLPAAYNGTGLTFERVIDLVEALRTNTEPELFGDWPVEPLGGSLPAVVLGMTNIDDEWTDIITFSSAAVPSYTRTGPVTVLGGDGPCEAQTVRKYVTRMDDPADNPVRWVFSVVDRRGVAIDEERGEYRVGLRRVEGVDWLTEWRAARPLMQRADGIDFEVVLLRSELPALGTERGIFEIAFRAMDVLGHRAPAVRACWRHVPLAAPLWVSQAMEVPASDPRSLRAVELGDGMAPLLNGVPLAEGKGIMEFEIRNGTSDDVYVTLSLQQSLAAFTKSWQKTNAFLRENLGSYCLESGDCTQGWPPDRRTTIVTDELGTIAEFGGGVVVRDLATGSMVEPCEGCEPSEYRIKARRDDGVPSAYQVMVVVTDLSPLAPQPLGEDYGPFHDLVIDPVYLPLSITGRTYGQVRHCADASPILGYCDREEVYMHYLALQSVMISLEYVRVTGETSPTATLPPLPPAPNPDTFAFPRQLQSVSWMFSETLPPVYPVPSP